MIADCTGSQRETILRLGIYDAYSALDVGCGNGEKTFFIARHVKRAVGIDPDENLIKVAKTNYNSSNLTFQVGRGESLCFPPSSFNSVLFNESLHHVPAKKQKEALRESFRVLEPKGKLLITEPIYDRGTFEKISIFYNDEKEQRQRAINAIESVINAEFKLSLKKEIHIGYYCKGFDDLYENDIITKPHIKWNEDNKQNILDILKQCDKSSEGDYIIDYFASVWLLTKR